MHIMSAREAKQQFGELMDRAMRGERVGITRNGRLAVVVTAAPPAASPDDTDGGSELSVAEPAVAWRPSWRSPRPVAPGSAAEGWPPARWKGATEDVPSDDLIDPAFPSECLDHESDLDGDPELEGDDPR